MIGGLDIMKIFKTKFPKIPTEMGTYLALAALGASAAGLLSYTDYNRKLDNQLKYQRAAVVETPYSPNIGWDNFVHEGGGTTDDWFLFNKKLQEINGGDLTSFRLGDKILLLDLANPKTGEPDGKVLPENYSK